MGAGEDGGESDPDARAHQRPRRWPKLLVLCISSLLVALWVLLLVLSAVSIQRWVAFKNEFMDDEFEGSGFEPWNATLIAAVARPLTFMLNFVISTIVIMFVSWSLCLCTWRWERPRTDAGQAYCLAALAFSTLTPGMLAILASGTLHVTANTSSADVIRSIEEKLRFINIPGRHEDLNDAVKSLSRWWLATGCTFLVTFLTLVISRSIVRQAIFGPVGGPKPSTLFAIDQIQSPAQASGEAASEPTRSEVQARDVQSIVSYSKPSTVSSGPDIRKRTASSDVKGKAVQASGIGPAFVASPASEIDPASSSDVPVLVVPDPRGDMTSGEAAENATTATGRLSATSAGSSATGRFKPSTGGTAPQSSRPSAQGLAVVTEGPSLVSTSPEGSSIMMVHTGFDFTAPRPSPQAANQTFSELTELEWTDFQRVAAEVTRPIDQLEVALDSMCCMQTPFFYRYTILSAVERRVGGQGLVQFASISNTQEKAAIKFYLDKSAFERERELYLESQLKAMMPATLAIEDNAAGEYATPYGYTFPPFVIIEHGQSLDEWARRNNADFITIFQSLSHAVRALVKLHSFGYAHRDVKPGNILRRPNQHDWTLIDFGCTAQIGTTAVLCYSMRYAAPEVIRALEAGRKTIKVDPALDIWAIGVIAFEMLTGARAFNLNDYSLGPGEAELAIKDAVAGRTSLPWEGPAAGPRLEKLRGLKRTVLRCLERDPGRRPSAEALLKSWDHTFDNMQSQGTFPTCVAS